MSIPEYFIYKYTFSDNKIYIGQSQIGSNRYGHSYAYKNQPVYQAMIKDKNFKKEIIEMVEKKFVNNREEYWTIYYNSNDPKYGYNIKTVNNYLQTDLTKRHLNGKNKPILQLDLDGNIIAEYESISAAARAVNPNHNSKNKGSDIASFLRGNKAGRKTVYGYLWKYKIEE